jgi:hypothetical protein
VLQIVERELKKALKDPDMPQRVQRGVDGIVVLSGDTT